MLNPISNAVSPKLNAMPLLGSTGLRDTPSSPVLGAAAFDAPVAIRISPESCTATVMKVFVRSASESDESSPRSCAGCVTRATRRKISGLVQPWPAESGPEASSPWACELFPVPPLEPPWGHHPRRRPEPPWEPLATHLLGIAQPAARRASSPTSARPVPSGGARGPRARGDPPPRALRTASSRCPTDAWPSGSTSRRKRTRDAGDSRLQPRELSPGALWSLVSWSDRAVPA